MSARPFQSSQGSVRHGFVIFRIGMDECARCRKPRAEHPRRESIPLKQAPAAARRPRVARDLHADADKYAGKREAAMLRARDAETTEQKRSDVAHARRWNRLYVATIRILNASINPTSDEEQ